MPRSWSYKVAGVKAEPAKSDSAGTAVESFGFNKDLDRLWLTNPARLMDFEQFAEAGCRAMGFKEWEFVESYKANRHGSMVIAAEASAVGRAVMAFLQFHPEGFRGQMQHLYERLKSHKSDTTKWTDWPRSPTKLSTELSRLSKPLAAIGITLLD